MHKKVFPTRVVVIVEVSSNLKLAINDQAVVHVEVVSVGAVHPWVAVLGFMPSGRICFEQQDNKAALPPLHVNVEGGAVPGLDDQGNPVIITDEADGSFEQKPDTKQGAKKPQRVKASPEKGTMAVVKEDEAAA